MYVHDLNIGYSLSVVYVNCINDYWLTEIANLYWIWDRVCIVIYQGFVLNDGGILELHRIVCNMMCACVYIGTSM